MRQTKGKHIRTATSLMTTVALAMVLLYACNTGEAPPPPTGPESSYNPTNVDAARAGVTARVRPNSVTLPGDAEGGDALAVLVGYYRDADGNPVEGLGMSFTSDPVNPNITFNPPAGFTDANGASSTQVRVDVATPSGSYELVAYTSNTSSSAGPDARGQTTLYVGTVYESLRITTSTLGGPYQSDTTASSPGPAVPGSGDAVSVALSAIGGIPPYTWSSTGLPLNLTLVGSTIAGTLLTPGTNAISVTVTDSVGGTATASFTITAF